MSQHTGKAIDKSPIPKEREEREAARGFLYVVRYRVSLYMPAGILSMMISTHLGTQFLGGFAAKNNQGSHVI
jgi:hypothetical protein